MATQRTRRKSSGVSDLARAAAERGGVARDQIASSVIDRIVQNSTQDFQNYLASRSGGNANAAAQEMMAAAPQQPAPFGNMGQIVQEQPAPFGSLDQIMQEQPAPFGNPALALPPVPSLMPPSSPSPFSNVAMPTGGIPLPPPLMPSMPSASRPMEEAALMRMMGLL